MNEAKLGLHQKYSTEERFKAEQNSSSPTNPEKRKIETLLAQTGALVSDHVTVLPFEGLDDPEAFGSEKVTKRETEALHQQEVYLMHELMPYSESYTVSELIRTQDKKKMWKIISEAVNDESIISEFGGEIPDLSNLTPYEAFKLAGLIVAEQVTYDHLIADQEHSLDYMSRSKQLWWETLKKLSKKRFNEQVKLYKSKLDQMTPDEILGEGYGVCRHMALSAVGVFNVLKEHQQGDSLRDTYMFYYAPGGKALRPSASDDLHAYNVLLHVGEDIPGGGREITLSVIDPTWAQGENLDLDQTYRRISSTLGFLRVYGDKLNLNSPATEVNQLANQVLERVKTMPHHFGQFKDWVAAIKYSSNEDVGTHEYGVVSHVLESTTYSGEKALALSWLYQTPETALPFHLNGKETRIIKERYRYPIYNEVSKLSDLDNDYLAGMGYLKQHVKRDFRRAVDSIGSGSELTTGDTALGTAMARIMAAEKIFNPKAKVMLKSYCDEIKKQGLQSMDLFDALVAFDKAEKEYVTTK
ncbi:hypothetical protein KC573_03360 [candidate division WWE3 bacterium]|uniref:Uncharacterized protein n=1 Tax=candidate division WWE3 bacterium TaxID=2053526 RepID=A0A955RX97_UNCKA|nr:hypothetical protein [candidate division WWE3 bacterium]